MNDRQHKQNENQTHLFGVGPVLHKPFPRDRLQQVFTRLENSIDAGNAEGTMDVRLGEAHTGRDGSQ